MAAPKGLALLLDLSAGSSSATTTAAAVVLATIAASGITAVLSPAERKLLAFSAAADSNYGASALANDWSFNKQPVIKHLRVKPKSIKSAFCPRNLMFSVAKSLLIPFGLLLDDWFDKVRQAELIADMQQEQGGGDGEVEWPAFPRERVRPALAQSAFMFAKDLAVTLLRLAMQNWVWRTAPVTLANKLLKDFRASAVRKTSKVAWYSRPARIAVTTSRAAAIGYAADCTVTIAYETYFAFRQQPPPGVAKSTMLSRRVWAIVRFNVCRCALSLSFASAAVGLVTTLAPAYPGTMASASFLAADTYAQLVLVPMLLAGTM